MMDRDRWEDVIAGVAGAALIMVALLVAHGLDPMAASFAIVEVAQ